VVDCVEEGVLDEVDAEDTVNRNGVKSQTLLE
jgi:hypothetical protein